MLTQILDRCEAIEECYEFMLAYAAQGLPTDESSPRVRKFLHRAVNALHGLTESCKAVVKQEAFLGCWTATRKTRSPPWSWFWPSLPSARS